MLTSGRLAAIFFFLVCAGLERSLIVASGQAAQQTEKYPWAQEIRCRLNPARHQGLHPDAYLALQSLAAAHRITQGINHSPGRGNVHDTDGTVNGNAYTGAVDISVRCLTQARPYQFWQPSAEMKDKVRTLYRAFN